MNTVMLPEEPSFQFPLRNSNYMTLMGAGYHQLSIRDQSLQQKGQQGCYPMANDEGRNQARAEFQRLSQG